MKSLTTTLAVLLAGSLVLNVIFWYNSSKQNTDCFVTGGWEEPQSISQDDAIKYSENYKASMPENENLGGVITRSAFDDLMCVENCNAIAYTFGRMPDKEGKMSGIFVIYNGVNVSGSGNDLKVTGLSTPFYITRHWCPPTCFAID